MESFIGRADEAFVIKKLAGIFFWFKFRRTYNNSPSKNKKNVANF